MPTEWVVTGGRVVSVTRRGRCNGADGAWVLSPTGDPGTSGALYPVFAPDWTLRPALIGDTVCEQPWPHGCGRAHVSRDMLRWLPRVEGT